MRLSSIITAFEAQFMTQYQTQLLPSHRKALASMKGCRDSLVGHAANKVTIRIQLMSQGNMTPLVKK